MWKIDFKFRVEYRAINASNWHKLSEHTHRDRAEEQAASEQAKFRHALETRLVDIATGRELCIWRRPQPAVWPIMGSVLHDC